MVKRYSLQDIIGLPSDENMMLYEADRRKWIALAEKYPDDAKRKLFGICPVKGRYEEEAELNWHTLHGCFPKPAGMYCRIRGRSVTKETAEKTIQLFSSEGPLKDSILPCRFYEKDRIFGFCHPDGTVGIDWCASKYSRPFCDRLTEYFLYSVYLKEFDLVMAISSVAGPWPYDYRRDPVMGRLASRFLEKENNGPGILSEARGRFSSAVKQAVWIHEGCVDILEAPYDMPGYKYREYEAKYGNLDNKFSPFYYSDARGGAHLEELERYSYLPWEEYRVTGEKFLLPVQEKKI